ncbi:MAG TPA: pitrilysin family protein [Candidatus Limnocylindrales bacterium]|nr:pitrilysin family protein [Candidatus Limnocylindrales bacterium]
MNQAHKLNGAPDTDTRVFQLANGMKVVIREDHFAPVVAEQVWVQAGGADETAIEAGIAHVHEHMLFKGTARRGVGEIAGAVESSGGSINAWTSWDQTVYHLVLASRFAGEGIDILADATQHSSFDPGELDKELGVVMEEWKRGQDSPSSRVYDLMFATAYSAHPYKRPVIGTEKSIKGLTRELITSFYKRYYSPSNMTLIVVGDVNTEAMKREIEAKFGPFADHVVQRPARPVEPAQKETRFASAVMDVQEAQIAIGFHIPDANHKDTPALDVLAHILGGGESSRVYRRLVAEHPLATSAGAFAYTPPDPGLFLETASCEADDVKAVLDGLIGETARIRDNPVSEEELARAKTNLESDFVYRSQTVQGQSRELGYAIVVHKDLDYAQKYIQALHEITAADVQKVARKYLTPENMTGVTLRPTGSAELVTLATLRADAQALATKKPVVEASSKVGAARQAKAPPATRADTQPKLVTLPNGVRLIVQEHHAVPMFSVRAAVLGGLLAERKGNNGVSNFVAEMLTRGTEHRTREQLAANIESLAGDLGGFAGRSSFGVAGTFLSEYLNYGLSLTMEVLLDPAFPADEVEKTRREILLAIKNRADESAQVAFDLAYKTVYPDHPYGMTTLGEPDSVAHLTADDLRRFYDSVLDPESLVVTVVGDIDSDQVIAKLSKSLSRVQGDGVAFTRPERASTPTRIRRARIDTNRKQSHVVVAFPGAAMGDPERYPLSVLDTVLSRQGGRLFYELRDKQALAYTVSSFSTEGYDPGLVGGYIATDPSNESRALDGLLSEFEKIRQTDIKAEELARAQRYLIGNYEIALQTNSAIAENMTFNELYGLGYLEGRRYATHINAVGTENVRAVANRFLTLDTRVEAVVGPPSPGAKEKE